MIYLSIYLHRSIYFRTRSPTIYRRIVALWHSLTQARSSRCQSKNIYIIYLSIYLSICILSISIYVRHTSLSISICKIMLSRRRTILHGHGCLLAKVSLNSIHISIYLSIYLSIYIYIYIDLSILDIGQRPFAAELSRRRTLLHGHGCLLAKVSIYRISLFLSISIYLSINIGHRSPSAKLPCRRTILHGHGRLVAKVSLFTIYSSIYIDLYRSIYMYSV